MQSDQILIEPLHSLQERLFLRKLLGLLAQITSDRETVHDSGEKIDLVWLLRLKKDDFALVTLLGGEDLVSFRGSDREGARDCGEFAFFYETKDSQNGTGII
jgi:hypothetical protein